MHKAHLAASMSVLAVTAAISISQKPVHLVCRLQGLCVTFLQILFGGLCRKSRSSGLLNPAFRHVVVRCLQEWWPRAG